MASPFFCKNLLCTLFTDLPCLQYPMLKILILTAILIATLAQKAILMSSSIGYYNIRQVNDIVKIYHHLRNNGFRDQDILLYIGELQPCCEKNHQFGKLSFYDGDYTNTFKQVEVDYYQSQIHAHGVARNLMGYYRKHTLNKKKLQINQNQPLFIYVTGHGGDLYFKIRQREALINEQFSNIFATLALKNTTQKVGLISDSCSAISPFEKVNVSNFIALASSSFGQKSLSHGYDVVLNQPKSDDFSFYFDQVLSGKAQVKGLNSLADWKFKDLQKYMDITKLRVNSKLVASRAGQNQKLSNFVARQRPVLVKKKYGKINVDQFFNI